MGRAALVKLLLDTHVWLWSFLRPDRLSRQAATALEAEGNELWLSPVSVWEALILAEKGRIELRPSAERWVRDALREVPLRDAPLNREVALESRRLAIATEDPADRFLGATAKVYELTLVTADPHLLAVPGLATLNAA